MREPGVAGFTLLCGPGLAGTDRTHRRDFLPAGVPRNRRRTRQSRDTRWPHLLGSGLSFEARGAGRCAATVRRDVPQSCEAGPSPERSRAIGGRCCPHSKILLACDPGVTGINNFRFFSGASPLSGSVTRHWRLGQLTKRRSRTFITRPIARKTNKVAEPP
jgi:hypothetical protein